MTLQERLMKILQLNRKVVANRTITGYWKSHIVLFRKGEENGSILCYESEVAIVIAALEKEAEFIHVYEVGKTVYTKGLNA